MKVTHFDAKRRFMRVELTERNLTVLLEKLKDRNSARTIIKADEVGTIEVHAVHDEKHYDAEDREPGPMLVRGEVI